MGAAAPRRCLADDEYDPVELGGRWPPDLRRVAGLLLALAPAALAYADQVRMYSFLSFLIIWVWYAQERWLSEKSGRFGVLWIFLSQALVIYSHGAGLVMLSGCVL